MSPNIPQTWYQRNAEPSFSCGFETLLGSMGDGHKWICDPHRIAKQSECLVISVGSETETSFEDAVFRDISSKCMVHTFDCTLNPKQIQIMQAKVLNNPHFHFYPWCIGPEGSSGQFKTVQQALIDIGLAGKTIDIFKIDCEGCEWVTYRDWLNVDIRQIQVELHKGTMDGKAMGFFNFMYEAGYVVFHKEANIQYGGGDCVEYSLLKLAKSFSRHSKVIQGKNPDPARSKSTACVLHTN